MKATGKRKWWALKNSMVVLRFGVLEFLRLTSAETLISLARQNQTVLKNCSGEITGAGDCFQS